MNRFIERLVALSRAWAFAASVASIAFVASPTDVAADKCKDRTDDPAGCQPSTFGVPIADFPSSRVTAGGQADSFSSDKNAL